MRAAVTILVIGDPKTKLGLCMVGVEGRTADTVEEANRYLDAALQRDDVLLLLITHEWAARLRERVDRLKMSRLRPVVLEIPGSDLKPPEQSVAELVERALGIHLRT